MAARSRANAPKKTKRERTPSTEKAAEDRMFSGSKLKRVLAEDFKIDFKKFLAAYDSHTGRARRGAPLSAEEKIHIERFFDGHQNITQLANELGCAITSAHSKITKYTLEKRAEQAKD